MLGKIVEVIIDRPLGTYHPEHKSIYYSVNYGYIKGIVSGDGEELDAYILGINEPLEKFTGKVIAIIHRLNDVEDKLIGAPIGMRFSKEEIEDAINFQEQYYDTEIEVL